MIEHSNIFYVPYINVIGGVEQFVYEIAKKYYMYDIAVIYKDGDPKQLSRLRKYVQCYKDHDQKYKCKKLFCNYSTDITDRVEAEEYIQIIHAMYKTNKITPVVNDKVNKYIAVSEIAKQEYKELTGIECEVFHNPLSFTEEDKQKPIVIVSATRLTAEKGKDRIKKLGELLDQSGIKWLWLIFTNDTNEIDNKNIVYLPPRLDIRPFLKIATYGSQLSDCEGDCYFTRECEAIGLPLLITPIPSFKEQGLIDGVNCYYVPFDVDIDVKKFLKVPTYKPYIREDHWEDMLVLDKSNYYIGGKNMKVEVKCLQTFYDLKEKCDRAKEETWVCDRERADHLVELGLAEITGTIKETKKEKATPKTRKEKATQ